MRVGLDSVLSSTEESMKVTGIEFFYKIKQFDQPEQLIKWLKSLYKTYDRIADACEVPDFYFSIEHPIFINVIEGKPTDLGNIGWKERRMKIEEWEGETTIDNLLERLDDCDRQINEKSEIEEYLLVVETYLFYSDPLENERSIYIRLKQKKKDCDWNVSIVVDPFDVSLIKDFEDAKELRLV